MHWHALFQSCAGDEARGAVGGINPVIRLVALKRRAYGRDFRAGPAALPLGKHAVAGGENEGCEDGDDPHHHQQLDHGEGIPRGFSRCPAE